MSSPLKDLVFVQDFIRLKSSLPVAFKPGVSVRGYFGVGLFLLTALIVQQSTGWRWTLLTGLQDTKLTGLQDTNTYKLATGLGLLAFVLYQWRFSVKRAQGEQHNIATMMGRHKLLGTLLPLFFFFHSQTLGYGYQKIFSLTLFLIFLTGLFNSQIVTIYKSWYRPVWISAHIGLSTALLLLMAYHVYVNYAFK
jgi:methionine sulfoxide reductase heme-binding subunit